MTILAYETATLNESMQQIQPDAQFFLNTFYGAQVNFDTEKIAFEGLDPETRNLAPFVSPNVEGKPQRINGMNMREFRPAYVKPKHSLDHTTVMKRRPGEALGGSLSPEQRAEQTLAYFQLLQKNQIMRRLEWMAAQATIAGAVTVAGDDYPTVTVDFQRAAGNSFAAGTAWTNGASRPLQNLEDWAQITLDAEGQAVTDWVLPLNVWRALVNHADFKDLYKNFQSPGLQTLPDFLPKTPAFVQYRGQIGDFRFWIYTGSFVDDVGATQRFLPDGVVVGVARDALKGVRAFGAIRDVESLVSTDIFVKSWVQPDPSVRYLMSQSAPLVVPVRPNATVRITGVA